MKRTLLSCLLMLAVGISIPSMARSATNPEVLFQAQKTAKGVVLDDLGEPLIGAHIVVVGTSRSAVTDINGAFEIQEVIPGSKLLVKYLGYLNTAVDFTGDPLKITMKVDATGIDEVIVVGYSSQQRNAVTGSLATVTSEKLKDQSTANVATMLQGKVAGVNVATPSGKPGETAKITIRGKGSISSSLDPIWVVDGVIWNRDPRLSPQEIATLTVLKDASATALYGSRASNGVIVVTTAKGKSGQLTFNANVNVGIKRLNLGNLEMMNSRQLYDYQQPFNSVAWLNEDLTKHDTDWFKETTQSGLYTNASFSFNGGSETTQSYLLMDYYRESATVKEMNFQRFTLRSNNDYKWAKNFTAFTKIQTQYETQKDQSGSLYDTYLYLPWDYIYNEDGSMRTGKEQDWYGRDSRNFMYNQYSNWSKKQRVYVSATAGFKWKLTEDLAFESNNNVAMFLERAESYTDPTQYNEPQANGGEVYNWYQLRQDYFTNQMLRYTKSIGKHDISALGAYEFTRSFDQYSTATAKGVTSGKEVIDGTTGMKSMTGVKSAFNIQSILFNVNYAYDSRYMFQASYRRDGSSKFGKNNQYGNFYTFSGGWNIANEKFWEPMKEVADNLKLRASWGVVGNTPTGNYNHLSLYSAAHYNQSPANFPSQLGNPDLTWEKNQSTDIGIDASFLKRIRLSMDWYNKKTTDLLYSVQLSTITGYNGQWQNIGAISNKGFEVSIDADIIQNKDWVWNLDFNIGFNKNKIIELYGGKPQISGIRRFEEGRDMDELYMAEWAGVNPKDGSPQWYTGKPGEERTLTGNYNSATGDNRAYIGSAAPKYTGGFGTTLSWKELTFNANFSYSVGGKLYSQLREVVDSDGAYVDYNSMVLYKDWSRWEKEGDIATHPKAVTGGNNMAYKESSRYVEDGSFLSLRNVSLSYNLPKGVVKQLGVKGASVSFSADNLLMFTKYSLISPDVAAYSADGYAGWGAYPMTRNFTFGLNVRF